MNGLSMNLTNATTLPLEEHDEEHCHLPTYAIVIGIIMVVLIMIIGTMGNSLVCIVLCLYRKRFEYVSHLFVINVALSDLLTSVTVLPFDVLYWLNFPVFPLPPSICKLWNTFFFAFMAESSLSLCMVSFDIYLAVTRPLHYNMILTSARAYIVISLSWVWTIVLAILIFIYQEEPPENEYLFELTPSAYGTYLMVHIGVPSIIIPVLYAKIFLIARSHAKKISPSTEQNDKIKSKRTNKLSLKKQLTMAKTFFCITMGFFLCWYPFFAVQLFYVFGWDKRVHWCNLEIADTIVCWFAYIQCCLNPVYYSLRRNDIRQILRRSVRRNEYDIGETTTGPSGVAKVLNYKQATKTKRRQTENPFTPSPELKSG